MPRFFAIIVLFVHCTGLGQNLAPNPSFEEGTNQPTAWTLRFGAGHWEDFAHSGQRSVSVTGTGGGCVQWQTTGITVQPGKPYVVRFWGLATNSVGNQAFGGFNVAHRYFNLTDYWAPYEFVATMPTNASNPLFLFGECNMVGKYVFDDVEVFPVLPVHTRFGGFELGAGETLRPGRYAFQSQLETFTGNHARCLNDHTAFFVTDRWVMDSAKHVTYRHGFDGITFTNARVTVTLNYYLGGDLLIEASPDGQAWQEIGRGNHPTTGYITTTIQADVPPDLLPAQTLYIRLRATGSMWIKRYTFDGDLPGTVPHADGHTLFFEQQTPELLAQPFGIYETPDGWNLSVALQNPNDTPRTLALRAQVYGPVGTRESELTNTLAPYATNTVILPLPPAGVGENTAWVRIWDDSTGATLLHASAKLMVAAIRDSSFGSSLPAPQDCEVWWCEGTYKVSRDRSAPAAFTNSIELAAARNEFEPFQLILRPLSPLTNVTLSVSDFVSQENPSARIASTNVEICIVEYVPVTQTTDYTGAVGDHPDPLVPLSAPIDIPAGTNHPLWLTVYVPKGVPAGFYSATVTIQSPNLAFAVPVRLRVFDFTLPDETHTKTAYGATVDTYWHSLTNKTQEKAVWELYLENFRKHRISPYWPHAYAPIKWSLVGGQSFTHDFSDFDAAMSRYLDDYKFSSFNLIDEPWTLGGHPRFSTGYRQLFVKLMQPIMAHLREKGWLDKAYSYWYDEPQPASYPFVIDGMKAHLEAAPGLPRLLTIHHDPPLYGHVDRWVPFLNTYNPVRTQERLGSGEEIWWYVAIAPPAPHPNNFIDHPAINHRIRIWMAQKFGVTGELYWRATWYKGKDGLPRNPWDDAMSIATGGFNLGNGDGVLLYPPVKTQSATPVIAGPLNSLRWEILREALEDGEYFWLLDRVLADAMIRLGNTHPAVLEGQAARQAALGMITSRTEFERNPQKLHAVRQQIAEAIESLDDGRPFIVRPPKSQAVAMGDNTLLRVEALGWPTPSYQWRHNGTNIPSATTSLLSLSSVGPEQLGAYTVIASNAAGMTSSDVANLAGYWITAPQILTHPASLERRAGYSAVLAVTAVSALPLTYNWLFNGAPLSAATNSTLVLTNLTAGHAGAYSVIISNASGSVTSAPANLAVLTPTSLLTLVTKGAAWKYSDLGIDLGSTWRQPGFDDSGWSSGSAPLGYGDGDESTVVSFGPDPNSKHPTTYFRRAFFVPWLASASHLVGRLQRDDGAVVYLNGTEIFRSNLPGGEVGYGTWATDPIDGIDESSYVTFPVPPELLQNGINVLAVEVHQYAGGDEDLSFDFELTGTWAQPPQILSNPSGLSRHLGDSALFSITSASMTPVAHQWMIDDTPLTGATNSTLLLTNLTHLDAGTYSVTLSNLGGMTTSAPAALEVFEPPILSSEWLADGSGLRLFVPGNGGVSTILVSTNLVDWTELASIPPRVTPAQVIDSGATGHAQRFYRLRIDW